MLIERVVAAAMLIDRAGVRGTAQRFAKRAAEARPTLDDDLGGLESCAFLILFRSVVVAVSAPLLGQREFARVFG